MLRSNEVVYATIYAMLEGQQFVANNSACNVFDGTDSMTDD